VRIRAEAVVLVPLQAAVTRRLTALLAALEAALPAPTPAAPTQACVDVAELKAVCARLAQALAADDFASGPSSKPMKRSCGQGWATASR
jgi:hypothetical protein